ncbi:MAG: hypothetical protein ACLQVJ_03375 [Syntrophobacteraceae bacterium]
MSNRNENVEAKDKVNPDTLGVIKELIYDYTRLEEPTLKLSLPVGRVVDEQLGILDEQLATMPDSALVRGALRTLHKEIGEPLESLVHETHDVFRKHMENELRAIELWKSAAGVWKEEHKANPTLKNLNG